MFLNRGTVGVEYTTAPGTRGWERSTHWSRDMLLAASEMPMLCKSFGAMSRLIFPALVLALFFPGAPLRAQCPGRQLPAGSVPVAQNSGTFAAPGNGKFDYSQFPIDLTQFPSGGTLTIVATLGNGRSKATFSLWLAGTVMMAAGIPSSSLTVGAAPGLGDQVPGSCVTLVYHFLQPQKVILGVTGSWFVPVGAKNSVNFSAYVQPTGGLMAPAVAAAAPGAARSAPATPVVPAAPAAAAAPSAPAAPTAPTIATTRSATATPNAPAAPATAAAASAPGAPSGPAASGAPNSPVTSKMIQSVSIQNSPGVPDTGGHCIICGLVTGNLTAVEPNLVICVTATGTTGGRRTCTAICPHGHDCKQRLGGGVRLNGANPSVHVEVLDNDKQGKIQQLAAFDEKDATQCTTAQPCKVNDADDQAAGTLVSFEFGNPEGCVTSAAGRETGPVLVASTMLLPGSLPAQTSTSSAQLAQGDAQCPKMITFTSYSGAITSEQLFEAYLSIYKGSLKFSSLMDNLGQHLVNVVIVANDPQHPDPEYARLSKDGVAAYQYFLKNHPSDPSGKSAAEFNKPPSADEFAYTTRPDSNGVIDVVISAGALQHWYYPGFSRNPAYPSPLEHFLPQNIGPQIAPIQLSLAYELGSNVAALVKNPCYQEKALEADTNEILKEAFPLSKTPPYDGFVPNESIATATGTTNQGIPIPTADRELSGAEYSLPAVHPVASVQGTGLQFDNMLEPPNPVTTYYSTDRKAHTGISLRSIGFASGTNCP